MTPPPCRQKAREETCHAENTRLLSRERPSSSPAPQRHRPRDRADLRARGRQCGVRRHQRGGASRRPKETKRHRRPSAGADHRRDQARGGRGDDRSSPSTTSAVSSSCSIRPAPALRRAKFLDIDDDLFERTFDLNVKGTFYAMQAVLPHMLENKCGVIVNVGQHGAQTRRARLLGALRRGQGRGRHHDPGRRARIRHARHPLPVDLARPDRHRRSRRRRRPRPNWRRSCSTTCR